MIEKGYSEDMAGRNIKLGEDSVQLRQISVAVLETEQTQARAHTWNQKTGHREEGVRGGGCTQRILKWFGHLIELLRCETDNAEVG